MTKLTFAFCLIFGSVLLSNGVKLPSYLPPCVESDPDFDTCAKASIRAALPHFLNGDPEYNVPRIEPLTISKIKLNSNELNMEFQNVEIYGMGTVKGLDEFHWNKTTNIVTGQVTTPMTEIKSDYTVTGRILVLPITSNGKFNLKLENVVVQAEYPVEFIPQPDGLRKLKLGTGKFNYTMGNAHIQLDNLFGNKELSDNMNKLLNEQWEVVLKDLGETIPITLDAVVKSVTEGIFNKISV